MNNTAFIIKLILFSKFTDIIKIKGCSLHCSWLVVNEYINSLIKCNQARVFKST